MNLTELIADVRDRLDEAGDGADLMWKDTEITRYLNQACRKLATELENLEATETQDVIAGQASYPLPPDFLRLARVTWNAVPLRPTDFIRLRENESQAYPTTAQTGTPEYYWMWGGDIYLYPAPAASLPGGLAIWYYRTPSPLVDGDDVPDHPERLHDALPLYALYLGYQKDGESNNSQIALRQWREEIMDERVFIGVRNRTDLGQIYDGDD